MAEVQLGLGASVDIATGTELEQCRKDILDALNQNAIPLWPLRLQTGSNLTASPAVLDLAPNGVPTGRIYDVRRVSILAPTDIITNVTRVLIFQGNQTTAQTTTANWSGTDFVTAVQVPANGETPTISLGKGQCILREQEHLWVMLVASVWSPGIWFATASGFETYDDPRVVTAL